MTTRYLISMFLLMISAAAAGQKEGLESITQNDLRAYMTFFASDNMKGRETGTPENELAQLFLKTTAMKIGLKPVPQTGDYLQEVPLLSSQIKPGETYISATNASGEELVRNDSIVYLMAPFATLEASSKLVFAGYGYTDTTAGYDDYKDLDITDKVVMIMTGSPAATDPHDLNAVFSFEIERQKIFTAFGKKVKSILYVYDPRSSFADAYASGLADMGTMQVGSKVMSLKPQDQAPSVQIAFITRYTADQLLKKSGNTLKSLEEKIIRDKKPVSFESPDVNVTFRTTIEKTKIQASNIIGIVEGSDPVLKNEYVIYTAHFDHVGVNKEGKVFNGADDNASGSMALLEVAQAFESLKKKPLRTIIFAWVNGEEKGLLGSEYYSENPVFSLDKTLLDINLDMIGRSKTPADTGKIFGFEVNISNPGEIQMFTDQKGKDFLGIVTSASKQAGIRTINMGRDPQFGSSDYAPFMGKGVPAIFFNSGVYPDLHSINDDVEKIDFDKMERVSKMVFLIGYNIANQKKRFVPDTIKAEHQGE